MGILRIKVVKRYIVSLVMLMSLSACTRIYPNLNELYGTYVNSRNSNDTLIIYKTDRIFPSGNRPGRYSHHILTDHGLYKNDSTCWANLANEVTSVKYIYLPHDSTSNTHFSNEVRDPCNERLCYCELTLFH